MMTCAPGQFSLQLRAYYEFECCCSETQTALETGAFVTLCQCASGGAWWMQILEDSHDKYDRGHCAECGTWCHRDHGPGKIFHVCVTMFWCCRHPAGPAQPSPAQPSHSPFSLSSVRWNIFFINSQYFWVRVLGVWLLWVNLLVLCHPHLLYLWDLVALLRQPTLSQQRWSALPATNTATTVECWDCCCPNTMTQLPNLSPSPKNCMNTSENFLNIIFR